MSTAMCYVLHVKCDHMACRKHGMEEFTGETQAEALRKARKHGWYIANTVNVRNHDLHVSGRYALCKKHAAGR